MSWLIIALGASCGLWEQTTCGEETPGQRVLRRLTHAEYDRTVQDLLGTSPTTTFAADAVVDGFRNDAAALVVEGLLAEQYRGAAEELAASADLDALVPCDPAQIGDEACALSFIQSFGTRAFRRPPSEDDLVRYGELWAAVAADDGFDTGIQWVITAMLQSPHFLYRSELGVRTKGRDFELTDWEMASALSYSLWGTMPDDALFDAADAGELSTDAQIDAQVDRMLADPRAQHLASDFLDAWLDLGQLDTVAREELTGDLRQSMRSDIHDWFESVAQSGGTLADVMSAGALLTHPAVLTTHARSDGSSPIHRGLMVRERLLCEELPPPPANIDISPPPFDPTLSTRERFSEHASNSACAECHDLMDPLGHGFEHYDQLGRWRTEDAGRPVDATGHVDGIPYDGVEELSEQLVLDERFRSCFVYSWRRHVRGTFACGDDLGADVGLLEPLAAVPTTYGFRVRRGRRSEGDTFAVGVDAGSDEITIDGPLTDVQLDVQITSDWGGGYCANGEARNTTDETVEWVVTWPRDGSITSIWNAEYRVVDGEWVFQSDNPDGQALQPDQAATFGFCVNR